MQRWKCHKEVGGEKIVSINVDGPDGSALLHLADGTKQDVSAEYMRKREPQVGGYYIKYEDGYKSFSPAEPFEGGYTKIPAGGSSFGIGKAILVLRDGGKVSRHGWNGPGQYLKLQVPDAHSANTLPYVYIITIQGHRVPWMASQTDLLACDWFVAK